MARAWYSIRVELVSGRSVDFWPRPGRLMVADPSFTFRQLANAINTEFARWDRAHLHRFVLEDGSEIVPLEWWDDANGHEIDDSAPLSLVAPGDRFAFEFDFGDSWEHLCTVGAELVDPKETYGAEPHQPVSFFGWGDLPDQYGRRWADDDGEGEPPRQPDPPTSDLSPLLYHWGDRGSPAAGGRLLGLGGTEDWDEESWRQFRSALYRNDGREIVDVLLRHDPLEVAQVAGDGLLIALQQGIGEATWLARLVADRVRERFLPGDDILAQQLDAALGLAPPPDLTPIDLDLEELATYLEGVGDLEGCRLDVTTGQFWPHDPVGLAGVEPPDYWEDDSRWIEVYGIGSKGGWDDMSDFIGRIEERGVVERLERAIQGKGAFRRFRDIVFDHGDLGRAWQRFEENRKRGRARGWLAEEGYQVFADLSHE